MSDFEAEVKVGHTICEEQFDAIWLTNDII